MKKVILLAALFYGYKKIKDRASERQSLSEICITPNSIIIGCCKTILVDDVIKLLEKNYSSSGE